MVSDDVKKMLEGTVSCETAEELQEKIRGGKPLRVKFGMDPSSADLHLGHAVPFRYLRRLQNMGHLIVLIIGDATAMVGDPTGRDKTRPQLSKETVDANAETYLDQMGLILDMDRVEVVRNSRWFDELTFMDSLYLCGGATVAQMLERDSFHQRYKDGTPIGLHEFLYPMMQARDSVEVRADIEVGGTDQTFNLLAGRDAMRNAGLPPQICITLPILVGIDGSMKMSKSLGNAVAFTDDPPEVYGKVMSLPDACMEEWFSIASSLSSEEQKDLLAGSPREAKARLAKDVVAQIHGLDAASVAEAEFDRVFKEKGLPDEIESSVLPVELVKDGGAWIAHVLKALGLVESTSEAKRFVNSGGVRVDGEKIEDEQARLLSGGEYVVQLGKRSFHRVQIPS